MKKIATRKLEETSWLAQIIADRMAVESEANGLTTKWNCLLTLLYVVREADDPENDRIYYANSNGQRQILIASIPSLMQYGMDFDRDGMQAKLRGMAERYRDDDGNYIVSVMTTHDLNSAIIRDIGELLYQMGK